MKINNRRYIGCKTKLLDFIYDKWTLEEINERTQKLINQIIELYPYSSASDDVIEKHEILLDWGKI